MNNLIYVTNDNNSGSTSQLKKIFDRYAAEIVSEEQNNRILQPILEGISEGRYDQQKRNNIRSCFQTVLTLITALIFGITLDASKAAVSMYINPTKEKI